MKKESEKLNDDTPPKVRVDNQLVRYIPSEPVSQESVQKAYGGKMNGGYLIILLDSPKATIVIDSDGRIVVHGTCREEVARAAVREMLLRVGNTDEGMKTELGPIIASYSYDRPIKFDFMEEELGSSTVTHDEELGCHRINDTRHEVELLLWPNGQAVVLGATHPNLVSMAAVHWKGRIKEANLFVEAITE